ncbi:MAG: hypothetical protein N3F67_04405 [Acidilobaceae archaeon]|nr:hypothetical protein [Acidilobaceae archaeon]
MIADAGAIFSGLPLSVSCYTTPQVLEEIKDEESREILERALASGKLTIEAPSRDSVSRARELARRAGVQGLSEADMSIVALALELSRRCKVKVATDDRKLQATLARAGFQVFGIRYRKAREAR